MTYACHYFRFPTQAVMDNTLRAASLMTDAQDGKVNRSPHLDYIGEAWFNDAEFDSNGNVTKAATKRPGVYANLMWDGPIPPVLAPFEIFPAPADIFRTFAGYGP